MIIAGALGEIETKIMKLLSKFDQVIIVGRYTKWYFKPDFLFNTTITLNYLYSIFHRNGVVKKPRLSRV